MIDRKEVIKGLKILKSNLPSFDLYGYGDHNHFATVIVDDALALLKEHEAVKPRVSTVEQRCGNCNKVIEMDGWKACPWCGKRID